MEPISYHIYVDGGNLDGHRSIHIFSDAAFKKLNVPIFNSLVLHEITEPIEFNKLTELLTYYMYYFTFYHHALGSSDITITVAPEEEKAKLVRFPKYFASYLTNRLNGVSRYIICKIPLPENPRKAVELYPQLFIL